LDLGSNVALDVICDALTPAFARAEEQDTQRSEEGAQNRINQSPEKTTRDAVLRYISAGGNSGLRVHRDEL
jgi:hypothetical protein